VIKGHGINGAQIMFVGDYGGRDEISSGLALSGYNERCIEGFLKSARLPMKYIYRTLFIKDALTYLGKNKRKMMAEIEEAKLKIAPATYENILAQEIKDVQPNVIVPLGNLSLQFLANVNPIGSYRGSILPLTHEIQQHLKYHVRVIPTFSPRQCNEDYISRVYVQLDYNKIVENRGETGPIETKEITWVCRSMDSFNNFLNRQGRPDFIVFDIETYMGQITCIGFSFDGREGVSIPFHDPRLSFGDGLLLFKKISQILASEIPKVNQNIKFDWITLERFRLRVENVSGDTMMGFHLLYPELPKNLGFQNSIYTGMPYFKDEGGKETAYNPKHQVKDRLYLYNAKDCISTFQIHQLQLEDLKERGMETLYKEKIIPLIGIYKKIDEVGLRVDSTVKKRLNAKYNTLLDVSLRSLERLIGEAMEPGFGIECNPRSAKQVGKLLYEELKFPKREKTTEMGAKSYKTDKETLEELSISQESPCKEGKLILSLILNCRKIYKIIEYINTPLHPGDILKTSYNLAGTRSGRSSAGKTLDQVIVQNGAKYEQERLGRSLQTITKHGFEMDGESFDSPEDRILGKDLRSMFVPRRGYVYIEGDENQAEAREVAVLSNDFELLEQFDRKPKIHARTAALIYGLDPFTITKDGPRIDGSSMTYYDMGKRVRHAGNYNMGPFRLAQMTHLSLRECTQIMMKFHESNPKVRDVFHYEVYKCLKETSQLTTPLGRVRDFFDRHSETLRKEAISYIPQSTISDQLKFSLIPLKERCPWAIFVVEAHDSLLAEVPVGRELEYAAVFKKEIEQPIDHRKCSLRRDYELIIPAEFSIGRENWMDMEELQL